MKLDDVCDYIIVKMDEAGAPMSHLKLQSFY